MGFDLTILIFTGVALFSKHSARTDLWRLLFQDGLVYFVLSFTMNCIPAVMQTFLLFFAVGLTIGSINLGPQRT